MVTKNQKRISGPWLDRIDTHIEVPCVDYEKLGGHRILKLARTIVDLAGVMKSNPCIHLAEALQYRLKLMMGQ